MKKAIALAIAVLLIVLCCSCKKTDNTSSNNSSSQISNDVSSDIESDDTETDEPFEEDSEDSNEDYEDESNEDSSDDTINEEDESDETDDESEENESDKTDDESKEDESDETSSDTTSKDEKEESSNTTSSKVDSVSSKDTTANNKSEATSSATSNVTSNATSNVTSNVVSNVSSNTSTNNVSSKPQQNNPTQNVTSYPGSVEIGDSPILENYIVVEDDSTPTEIVPEYGAPSTLDTPWNATAPIKNGNSDKEAEELRNKILSSKNTAEIYEITGTTYYVSPSGNDDNDGKTPQTAFRTTNAKIFTRNVLKPGDAVLFERGGLWRLISTIKCKKGVTYGSYGEGEKPTFYVSPYNYADENFWIPSSKKNIWKVSIADLDIGLVVFNHGELVGFKKFSGLIGLEKNGDYYFNKNEDTLYVYYDGGNPGKAFEDIEIGLKKYAFAVSAAQGVTIDNLRIKYTGAFGISMSDCDDSTITNCEIGFIGGAIQNGTLRYGNGIQVWNGVVNHRIENCWFYQIYDAAVTFQGDYTYQQAHMSDIYKNITYTNNLFEYSTYSVEFWHGTTSPSVSPAVIENFNCTNNISRFAGYGWGDQRTDFTGNHICVFNRSFPNAKNNNITDNIFDLSNSFVVKWTFLSGADMSGFNISNNIWYHGKNRFNEAVLFGSWNYASNAAEFQSAILKFDSNPKLVVWVD